MSSIRPGTPSPAADPMQASGAATPSSPESGPVRRLCDAACYDHAVDSIQHIETHISHILLTGSYAYKIKKPLNLGFLDFSTLDKRLRACQEEVRLNQRLAPQIYLGVVPITGTSQSPQVNGSGRPIEYAVKMRQFPFDSTLDRLDGAGQLTRSHVEAIGRSVGRFHRLDCARAGDDSAWGDPEQVWYPVAQNFLQILPLLSDPAAAGQLVALRQWSEAEHRRLIPHMLQRRRAGLIRECHGDLHLGNLAWVDEQLLVFDCLEFDPALRWIDIQSEIAFCTMDLMQRGHTDLAWLLLNTWLEETGDYPGLALFRYYAVYRALVRVKIAAVRAGQAPEADPPDANQSDADQPRANQDGADPSGANQDGAEHARARNDIQALLALATRLTSHPWPVRIDITHGLSGSGKTTVTHALMQTPGAIRLRSDVERKRLAGLDAMAASGSRTGQGLYSDDATRRTYSRLADLSAALLEAGWPVIVDATFLARWQRDLFRELARTQGVPFHILDFEVPESTLRQRVGMRRRAGRDASEAGLEVLQHQIDQAQPLTANERAHAVPIHAHLPGRA